LKKIKNEKNKIQKEFQEFSKVSSMHVLLHHLKDGTSKYLLFNMYKIRKY